MADPKNFDWTIMSSDPSARRLVWAIECDVCKDRTPTPDVDRLSREDQDLLLKEVAARHSCKGR